MGLASWGIKPVGLLHIIHIDNYYFLFTFRLFCITLIKEGEAKRWGVEVQEVKNETELNRPVLMWQLDNSSL